VIILRYEQLLDEACNNEIEVKEVAFESSSKGLIKNNKIGINKYTCTSIEKTCILAEELGHYFTSHGDIIDQNKTESRKQEKRARNWAYEKLIPLSAFIKAYNNGIKNRYELSQFLDVTEDFINDTIKHYQEKYGLYHLKDEYIIYFDPLGVFKKIV
jgi:Zn-dependent peptidase ImmA (M78 family)